MNVLQVFEKCNNLWEDTAVLDKPSVADDMLTHALNKDAKSDVTIKGQTYEFLTPFMPVEELTKEEFSRPGIYIWQRLPQDDRVPAYYVGKALNLYARTRQHIQPGKQDSVALHAAVKKYGTRRFMLSIIEFCDKEELNDRERYWIKELNTYLDPKDYNLTPGGDGGRGLWKVTPEMFEQIVAQLRDTSDTALTFREIGEYWGLDRTTIGKINVGHFEYTKDLGVDIEFPIRSKEVIQRMSQDVAAKTHEKQAKAWNLILTHSRLDKDGKTVIQTGIENLGTFVGKSAAWDKVCEVERTMYNTSEDVLSKKLLTFRKGNRGTACFEPLNLKKFARKYTLEEIK